MSAEREAKLEILDSRSFERLRGALLLRTSEPVEELFQPNHYLDTTDLRIARSPGMLRIRTGDGNAVLTYKRGATFESGILQSEELEATLEDSVATRVLKQPTGLLRVDNDVVRQLREDHGDVELEYVGLLETRREVFRVDGRKLELDHGSIDRERFHELEIEADDVAAAFAWGKDLLDSLEVRWEPSRLTKLERLLDHLGRL